MEVEYQRTRRSSVAGERRVLERSGEALRRRGREPRGPGATSCPVVAVLSDLSHRSAILTAVRHLLPVPAEEHLKTLETDRDLLALVDAGVLTPMLVLLGPSLPSCDSEVVSEIRRMLPGTIVVGVVDSSAGATRRALDLMRAGADDVCVAAGSVIDAVELAQTVDAAIARRVVAQALEAVAHWIPATLRPFLEQLWVRCSSPIDPSEAAKLYHRSASTLARHLKGAGLPSPRALIAWGRLLHAAYLLQFRSHTVEAVAAVLGFSSAGALRNQLNRYAGVSPRSIRVGGVQVLVRLLSEALEAAGKGRHEGRVEAFRTAIHE